MAGRPRKFDEHDALRRAIDLFHARGYESVGVRELIDSMGVCRQSFYDTFGDKRELFLRSIRQYCADSERWFQERLAESPSPLQAVRDLLRDKADSAKAAGAKASSAKAGDCRGCLAMNSVVEWGAEDDEVAEVLRGNLRRVEKTLTTTLLRAQEAGELDPTADTKQLARFVLFVCLGYSAVGRLGLSPRMAESVLAVALGALPEPQTA